MAIARVVVNLALDREFDYQIPERLAGRVLVGSRVWVPFGKGERIGYVVGLAEKSEFPELKEIKGVEGDREQIPQSLVALARWMADYYCCPKEHAVRALLPAVIRGGKVKHKVRAFAKLAPGLDVAATTATLGKRAQKQIAVIQALVRLKECESVRLQREAGVGPGVIKKLVTQKLVVLEQRVVDRDPFADDEFLPEAPKVLTDEQRVALDAVLAALRTPAGEVILLHGVTASGKTEVYLQGIAACLESGRDAIVLVPEIALTPQTQERFRRRFGDIVSVMHSGLSDGERYDEWMKVSDGRTRIVVGARSALFAPFRRLGLIVVDEEHENTYKQEESPRYNARDVAVVRGRMEHATVVLGTATPSLESVHNCEIGKYRLVEMQHRVDNHLMPTMEVIDMRAEAMLHGGPPVFSRRLQDLIRQRLDRGEQIILFLNRRGYASTMLCTKCGYVANCEDCSAKFTYHREEEHLICHYCGRVLAAPKSCPQCGDPGVRYSGYGTERIEAYVRKYFPHAALARMDSDTMTTKKAYWKAFHDFRSKKTQILIGTQMIAKGLDIENVTLVGILYADMALNLPDFRAGERTFQLVTQVSGRAGRGAVPGHVVVQTYTPFNPVLGYALQKDFRGFYEAEMETRKALQLPPLTHMVMVHFRGPSALLVEATAHQFFATLKPLLEPAVDPIGPMPCPITRIRKQTRYQLSLRGGSILRLTATLRRLVLEARAQMKEDVDIYIDVDPQSLL